MAVASVCAAVGNLVLGEVECVHDSITTLVPGSTNVGLAIGWIIAATARTTRVVEASADLASSTDRRVRLTSGSDVKEWFVTTNCVSFSTAAEALRNVLDAVVRDNGEVGVGSFGQES